MTDRRAASRNASRTRQRAARAADPMLRVPRFVGVDGEGWTEADDTHHYAMLSVGDRTLSSVLNLQFLDLADFLWSSFLDDPKAVYVGFYLGYDFAQWFKTLPEKQGYLLLHPAGVASRKRTLSNGNTVPFPVRYEGWEFDVLGMKRFKLRAEGAKNWLYVNDAGPFFQMPFMSVIDAKAWPDGQPFSNEDVDIIREGKARRADYHNASQWRAALPDLARYNVAENRVLGQVMGKYAEGLLSVGVELQRDQWYGPGAAAGTWLGKVGATRADDLQDKVPASVLDFARQSYYGGWFEVFAHGIVPGTSWEADITSAYPHAMSEMPDWEMCTYEHTGPGSFDGWGLVEATVVGTDPIVGAMLHRRKDGSILRPSRTRGVYWSFELEAAVLAGVVDQIQVHQGVRITRNVGSVLNAEIPELFNYRKAVGKNTSSGKAAKLIINSAYGKQAQSIGSPKFASSLAASFITAHCRTAILRAIAAQPGKTRDLLMVATDGVYFTGRPVGLNEGSDLGQWEIAQKDRLTIVMPGVHYSDSSRAAALAGDLTKLRSRGINAAAFAASLPHLDTAWTKLLHDPNDPTLWPTMEMTIKFSVTTPKSAINQRAWDRAGKVTRDAVRKLDSNPSSKRCPPEGAVLLEARGPYVEARGFVRTRPYVAMSPLMSTPYERRFGTADLDNDFGDSPEGPVALEIGEMLG